jgi:6-phosphogluconolactonase
MRRHNFADAEALARALAHGVAAWLSAAVKSKGSAVLAVSGGTTPQRFFDTLSREPVDWGKVTVTLVDERQVDESSPRSNARLVKASLLQNAAAAARFVPLYQNPAAADVPPFDVVVLGMGDDGHTASFFPGGDTLAGALAMDAPAILPISAPGSVEPRLTFTLPRLLAARHLVLHIQGVAKEETLMKALGHGPIKDMPIRAVLRASHELDVYWCP